MKQRPAVCSRNSPDRAAYAWPVTLPPKQPGSAPSAFPGNAGAKKAQSRHHDRTTATGKGARRWIRRRHLFPYLRGDFSRGTSREASKNIQTVWANQFAMSEIGRLEMQRHRS